MAEKSSFEPQVLPKSGKERKKNRREILKSKWIYLHPPVLALHCVNTYSFKMWHLRKFLTAVSRPRGSSSVQRWFTVIKSRHYNQRRMQPIPPLYAKQSLLDRLQIVLFSPSHQELLICWKVIWADHNYIAWERKWCTWVSQRPIGSNFYMMGNQGCIYLVVFGSRSWLNVGINPYNYFVLDCVCKVFWRVLVLFICFIRSRVPAKHPYCMARHPSVAHACHCSAALISLSQSSLLFLPTITDWLDYVTPSQI